MRYRYTYIDRTNIFETMLLNYICRKISFQLKSEPSGEHLEYLAEELSEKYCRHILSKFGLWHKFRGLRIEFDFDKNVLTPKCWLFPENAGRLLVDIFKEQEKTLNFYEALEEKENNDRR